ncbi:MAG TPA: hypothetical protein VFS58_11325, partial [Steroidobacteraceae bacterium]|nr:hypothetical protein [Steroidobacteraceae bacterium]
MKISTAYNTIVSIVAVTLLSACGGGGGGGGGNPPATTTFSVTPSAGANGSISPATAQTINQGSSTSFT